MEREKFIQARTQLGKTQKALAELLGVSLKAVQSYEQGWRSIPAHIERQIYYLLVNQRGQQPNQKRKDCWQIKNCDSKKECPAWEFRAGHMCWFLSGTLCECTAKQSWKNKISVCRECSILTSLIKK